MLILYNTLLDKSKGEIMKTYKAGIDIGSTTVKLVVLDAEGTPAYQEYRRHMAHTQETLAALLKEARAVTGPCLLTPGITGSGSIILSSARETVCPQITASAPMTLRDGNNIHSISASTVTIPTFLITDTPRTISVTGTGSLTFTWTDGVF